MSQLDLNQLMQMAQKLQADMVKTQEDLAKRTAEGQSGGGMVSVTVNGHFDVVKLSIEPSVVDKSDVAMLEDLVLAAVNQAISKMRDLTQSEMSKVTHGLPIPGMPTR